VLVDECYCPEGLPRHKVLERERERRGGGSVTEATLLMNQSLNTVEDVDLPYTHTPPFSSFDTTDTYIYAHADGCLDCTVWYVTFSGREQAPNILNPAMQSIEEQKLKSSGLLMRTGMPAVSL
jgi:hypothetical protein